MVRNVGVNIESQYSLANFQGNGMYLSGSFFVSGGAQVLLENITGTITSGANQTQSGLSYLWGGALVISGGNGSGTSTRTFKVSGGGKIVVQNNTFTINAVNPENSSDVVRGGVVYSGRRVELDGGSFLTKNNTIAVNYTESDGTYEKDLTDDDFSSNATYSYVYGGVLETQGGMTLTNGAEFSVDGNSLTVNESGKSQIWAWGAAIYVANTLNVTGSTINLNGITFNSYNRYGVTYAYGLGIYMHNNTMTVSNSTLVLSNSSSTVETYFGTIQQWGGLICISSNNNSQTKSFITLSIDASSKIWVDNVTMTGKSYWGSIEQSGMLLYQAWANWNTSYRNITLAGTYHLRNLNFKLNTTYSTANVYGGVFWDGGNSGTSSYTTLTLKSDISVIDDPATTANEGMTVDVNSVYGAVYVQGLLGRTGSTSWFYFQDGNTLEFSNNTIKGGSERLWTYIYGAALKLGSYAYIQDNNTGDQNATQIIVKGNTYDFTTRNGGMELTGGLVSFDADGSAAASAKLFISDATIQLDDNRISYTASDLNSIRGFSVNGGLLRLMSWVSITNSTIQTAHNTIYVDSWAQQGLTNWARGGGIVYFNRYAQLSGGSTFKIVDNDLTFKTAGAETLFYGAYAYFNTWNSATVLSGISVTDGSFIVEGNTFSLEGRGIIRAADTAYGDITYEISTVAVQDANDSTRRSSEQQITSIKFVKNNVTTVYKRTVNAQGQIEWKNGDTVSPYIVTQADGSVKIDESSMTVQLTTDGRVMQGADSIIGGDISLATVLATEGSVQGGVQRVYGGITSYWSNFNGLSYKFANSVFSFTDNTYNVTALSNEASVRGGAFYSQACSTTTTYVAMSFDTNSTVYFNGNEFNVSNHIATAYVIGGFLNTDLNWNGYYGTYNFNGKMYANNNTYNVTAYGSSAGVDGGVFYLTRSQNTTTFNLTNTFEAVGTVIRANSSYGRAYVTGGVMNFNSSCVTVNFTGTTVNMAGSTIALHTLDLTDSVLTGGLFYVKDSPFSAKDSTFNVVNNSLIATARTYYNWDNVNVSGGLMYFSGPATVLDNTDLFIDGNTISKFDVSDQGRIIVWGGLLHMTNTNTIKNGSVIEVANNRIDEITVNKGNITIYGGYVDLTASGSKLYSMTDGRFSIVNNTMLDADSRIRAELGAVTIAGGSWYLRTENGGKINFSGVTTEIANNQWVIDNSDTISTTSIYGGEMYLYLWGANTDTISFKTGSMRFQNNLHDVRVGTGSLAYEGGEMYFSRWSGTVKLTFENATFIAAGLSGLGDSSYKYHAKNGGA